MSHVVFVGTKNAPRGNWATHYFVECHRNCIEICFIESSSCRSVSIESVIKLGLFRLFGVEGTQNATGDQVKKLDVVANNAFKTSLERSGCIFRDKF